MNVTFAPLHIVVNGVEIVTDGVTAGKTVIVTLFEVAGLFETHNRFEVIIHEKTSLVAAVDVTKVGAFTPVLVPFFFHW